MREMKRCAIWCVRVRTQSRCSARRARGCRPCCFATEMRYVGKTAWTAAHRRWIAHWKLPHPAQQIAFEEDVQAVQEAGERRERLAASIAAELEHWRWRPVVQALQALRGIPVIHAVRLLAEIGDCARFRRLAARALNRNKIVVAIARELSGFVGAIAREIQPA